MRWVASLVAETHRILIRGGVFLVPARSRKPEAAGGLRLLYEASPIAFLIEQAGGGSSTGHQRVMDIVPSEPGSTRRPGLWRARGGRADRGVSPRPQSSRLRRAALRRAWAFSWLGLKRQRVNMSVKHPIIAVTGSSGAGTTSVSRTFEQIFRREKITAAFVEGDSFHRYDRADMQHKMAEAAGKAAIHNFSHFGPTRTCLEELERAVRELRRQRAAAQFANTCTTSRKRRRTARTAGTFTPWEELPPRDRSAVLRGSARRGGRRYRRRRPSCRPADRGRSGHQPRVDTKTAPGQVDARILHRGGDRDDPAADARLREYMCPQFSRTHVNFQRVPVVDTSNPFIARHDPERWTSRCW